MLIRPLVTLLLTVAIGVLLARRGRTRASASPLILWGIALIAMSVASRRRGTDIAETLLLQRHLRGVDDFLLYDLGLMLGYAFALGAILAMPWLIPSTASAVGSALRESVLSPSSWRNSFVRTLRWLLPLLVILLLWRWIGAI